MDIKSVDILSLFEESLTKNQAVEFAQIGKVVQVGDAHCTAYGLIDAVYGEMVEFEGGNKGIIFDLDDDTVTIFLLYAHISVAEHEIVKRTGAVFKTPVGNGFLGRVVNALGSPIDGLGPIAVEEYRPIEKVIPGIIERTPINQSLETGTLTVDALIPIGKGQRELIIGNRSTGKTSVVLDAILHQKDKNVICVYVSIGHRQANIARLVNTLRMFGALDYTIVISADASEPALDKYLAPYVGCTIAEFFKDQKKDVLIIYDDLSNHAIAYREMSLLMRRAPGREAYPGDVFYLHSRLLERAGKFVSGGSITALPIVEVQSDDITAYVPTNLISITDGQIFLDTKLFNSGVRPAINVELSVSRVGGAAQTAAMKKMVSALKIELAQYQELLAFSQFGSELDMVSQQRLARGARIVELLKQAEHAPISFVDQVLMLFLLKYNFLDTLKQTVVREFAIQFIAYIQLSYSQVYNTIKESGDITDEVLQELMARAQEFSLLHRPVDL